jgi:hypothetical protein
MRKHLQAIMLRRRKATDEESDSLLSSKISLADRSKTRARQQRFYRFTEALIVFNYSKRLLSGDTGVLFACILNVTFKPDIVISASLSSTTGCKNSWCRRDRFFCQSLSQSYLCQFGNEGG